MSSREEAMTWAMDAGYTMTAARNDIHKLEELIARIRREHRRELVNEIYKHFDGKIAANIERVLFTGGDHD